MPNEFAGHTPGPWRLDLLPDRAKIRKPENGSHICTVDHGYRDEDEANARLIAAAPDLLARAEKAERENTELRELFLALYDDERGHKRINRKSLLWDRIMRASEEIRALLAGVPS